MRTFWFQAGGPEEIRLRKFVRDTVLYVIHNDPDLNEEIKGRVRSLRIHLSEMDGLSTIVGPFIIQKLQKYRQIHPSLFMDPIFFKEFMSYHCREWLNISEPNHYTHFLVVFCEFCCLLAEEDRFLEYFWKGLWDADSYIYLFRELCPEPEMSWNYNRNGRLRAMPALSMPPDYGSTGETVQ